MKVAGIIAEYNPFHNGHAYHIAETRRLTGADYVVVVMSGDFVQRGEPAIADKYARTRMALDQGADLVIELPVAYAGGSAEYFASGAVRTLQALGVVDVLSFGCETTDAALLSRLAQLYREEPTDFQDDLQEGLRQGMTYPQARTFAAIEYLTKQEILPRTLPSEELISLLASPNTILGIEYLKAMQTYQPEMDVMVIPRKGSYHSDELSLQTSDDRTYASATAVRKLLAKDLSERELRTALSDQVPPCVADALVMGKARMCADDFSAALGYALMTHSHEELTQYVDITPDLADRILNHRGSFVSWNAFVDQIKTKQLTRARISRALLHVLLQITKKEMTQWKADDYVYYARALGFCKSSGPLLTAIKKNMTVPFLTKLADAEDVITSWYQDSAAERISLACKLLKKDIFAADLYEATAAIQYKKTKQDEYRHGLILRP